MREPAAYRQAQNSLLISTTICQSTFSYKVVFRMKKIAAIFVLLLVGFYSAAQELLDWLLLQ